MANYADERNAKKIVELREMISAFPDFTHDFFRGISLTTSILTRIAYAGDLKIFFHYIKTKNLFTHTDGSPKEIKDITLDELASLKGSDIEKFLEFTSYYVREDSKDESNTIQGKARKLAALRSFYNYYYRKELILTNPAHLVVMPKIPDKPIIQLDPDEVAVLLDTIESGAGLTPKQLIYHEKTKVRDFAIVSLILGTGIRISECIGINLENIDLKNNAILVVVKGQDQRIIYFGEEVAAALKNYLTERGIEVDETEGVIKQSGPLFVARTSRIGITTVREMVIKYSSIAIKSKRITPHKLRASFGTQLYRDTEDIYLVASMLGHKDVNTTRKHYSKMDDSRRRVAAKQVKLRG